MQSVAAWLVSRPQNAVLALAITMLLPGLATVSGAILIFLMLQQDLVKVLITAGLAGLIIIAVALVSGTPPILVSIGLVSFWLPILVLAGIMRSTKYLTLTTQLSVLIVLFGVIAFFALTSEPVEFWQKVIESSPMLQSLRLTELKNAFGVNAEQFAGIMTTLFAIGFWFSLVVVLLLGYWLYQQVPGKTGEFGRFCDLNFGRVIAFLLAVASVAGFSINAIWIQSIAIVLFAVFWLQGAAIVHWLHASGFVPVFVVYAAYMLTLVLPDKVFPALAVLGYTDAWFRFRHRVKKQQ